MADYSTNLEGSLSNIEVRAKALADELRDGTETRSRSLISELERVKSQTEAESERTLRTCVIASTTCRASCRKNSKRSQRASHQRLMKRACARSKRPKP